MVSVMKGLNVQKSRFAALSLDQDSDEEDSSEAQWQVVAPPKSKSSASHKKASSHGGQTHIEEGKTLSKSAKKRARKKRNKSTSSDRDVSVMIGTYPDRCEQFLTHYIMQYITHSEVRQ